MQSPSPQILGTMTKQLCILLALALSGSMFSQKFETDKGAIENLAGIKLYKIVFEYPDDLEVHKFGSEVDFLRTQVNKRESKEAGAGEKFKELWFKNRENRYEPTFIKEFNGFMLEDRHITVSKNYKEVEHTMVVKIHFIHPGKDIVLWHQKAEMEVTFEIYSSKDETLLYASKTVEIHGIADGDEFEKLTTAYGQLGRWSAKFFCRKT